MAGRNSKVFDSKETGARIRSQRPSWAHSGGTDGNDRRTRKTMLEDEGDNEIIQTEGFADGPTLVTHLPDIIVMHDHRRILPNQRTLHAVLLFLDISGFTALCEKYSMSGKTGTDQLTKTLNDYMSALVSEILSYDGDILKFAGDAILTMWQVTDFPTMQSAVMHVIQCALDVQKKNGEHVTSVGVVLKVKIGISAGEVSLICLGNEELRSYVELGRAVDAVNIAENLCEKGGDIIVSPTAWIHCYKITCEYTVLSDGKHIKVTGLLDTGGLVYEPQRTIPVTSKMRNVNMPVEFLKTGANDDEDDELPSSLEPTPSSDRKSIMGGSGRGYSKGSFVMSDNMTMDDGDMQEENTEISEARSIRRLRVVVVKEHEEATIASLKLYIATPVLKKLEERQPLEYLSEMRQVTIVFINLTIAKCTKLVHASVMQEVFNAIFSNCRKMQGSVSKIFLFDKGCTYIVVFGLPGFKHESDCAHALVCADSIHSELNAMSRVSQVSIGVTTGPTYCGVVGHHHRHEYTVIGTKVNMAARLMMYYPGKVTCDNETFYHSKLSKGNFIAQELKEMKGLKNVGTIRCFKPKENVKDTNEILIAEEEQRPIIGREDEVAIYEKELLLFLGDVQNNYTHRSLIVIEGDSGMGKTRMLDYVIATSLKKNVHVIPISLNFQDSQTPFNAMKMLLNRMFEFDVDATPDQRQNQLKGLFPAHPFVIDYLCLFNKIFNIKLPLPRNLRTMREEKKNHRIIEMAMIFLKTMTNAKQRMIFTIDDAHLMDDESWKCIPMFGHYLKTMVVMTMRTPIIVKTNTTDSLLCLPSTLKIHLKPLKQQHMAALSCQLLNVALIPKRLDLMIRQKSMGVPSWVECLLREYLYEGIIIVEKEDEYAIESMVSPAGKYLRERKPDQKLKIEQKGIDVSEMSSSQAKKAMSFVDRLVTVSAVNAQLRCVFVPNKEIDIGVPSSIKSMIQARIDHMEEIDQLVIKTASVLEQSFPRKMFEAIFQAAQDFGQISESFQRLSDQGIFACATKQTLIQKSTYVAKKKKTAEVTETMATCVCKFGSSHEERPMRYCRFLAFQSTSIQTTAYDMMLENNRRPLHTAGAHFLEIQVNRCLQSEECNAMQITQGFFVEDSRSESDEMIEDRDPDADADNQMNSERKSGGGLFKRLHRLSFKETMKKNVSLRKTVRITMSHDTFSPANSSIGTRSTMKKSQLINRHRIVSILIAPESLKTSTRRSTIHFNLFGYAVAKAVKFSRKPAISPNSKIQIPEDENVFANKNAWDSRRVLANIYPQIVQHYKGAGSVENIVYYLVESTAANISLFQYKGAKKNLDDIHDIFKAVKAGKNPFEGLIGSGESAWVHTQLELVQIERLTGQLLYFQGKNKAAIKHFKRALSLLGESLPRTKLHLSMLRELVTQHHHSHWTPTRVRALDLQDSRRLAEGIKCFHFVFLDLHRRGKNLKAAYVAFRMLNMAEEVGDDLKDLVCSLGNTMTACHALGWHLRSLSYELMVKARSRAMAVEITPDNVMILTDLFWSMFAIKVQSCSFYHAIDGGLNATNLCMSLHGNRTLQKLLPALVHAMFNVNRLKEGVDIMRKLQKDQLKDEDVQRKIEAWQHVCAMYLVLYFGVHAVQPQDSLKFLEQNYRHKAFTNDKLPIYMLACYAVVWYSRIFDRSKMTDWVVVAVENEPRTVPPGDLLDLTATMGLIEVKLSEIARMYAVCEREKNSLPLVQNLKLKKRLVEKDFRYMSKHVERMVVLKPNLLLFRAYYAAIKSEWGASRHLLEECIKSGQVVNNVMATQWAEHNREYWFPGFKSGAKIRTGRTVPLFLRRAKSIVSDKSAEADFSDNWRTNATVGFPYWSKYRRETISIYEQLKYSLPIVEWFQRNYDNPLYNLDDIGNKGPTTKIGKASRVLI